MGDLPAKTAMVSSVITFPLAGSATIQSDTTFNITVQMSNLVAGSFTNADATYFSAPQSLSGGQVVGHTHVTVQDMGASLNPTTALDPTQFAFFKGINDAGNGKGLLSATVTGGLPAGNYRVCTMASASNHQPVIMPVAQRGTADDCTKFTVIGNGNVANAASNNGSGGQAAAALAASAVAAGPGAIDTATAAASVASSSAVASTTSVAKGNSKASSSEASTTSVAKGGNKASSSEVSTTTKAGKDTTTSSVELSSSTTSTEAGKGGKTISTQIFANTTFAATTKATKSAKGNQGAAPTTSTTSSSTSASALSTVGTATTTTTTTNAGKGGKGNAASSASSASETVIIQKVVVIETFFEFVLSLGGLPPSVGKKGSSFVVLEEEFEDIVEAAGAACTAQFNTCVSFSGPGFSFEECSSQKESCGSAASTQTSASTAAQITATATVPPSATVTGSVISEATITTSVATSTSQQAVAIVTSQAAVAQTTTTSIAQTTAAAVLGATESTCTIVSSTVWVDAPSSTLAVQVAASSSASSSISNSPVSASSTTSSALAINTATLVSDASALGGIAAPAITDSGDSTRPFLVNGNTFVNKSAAVQRSCDIQFNACANAFNSGSAAGAFNLADCQNQEDDCVAAGGA